MTDKKIAEAGEYLFTNVGFSRREEPTLTLQQSDEFIDLQPLAQVVTLRFDMTTRFCIGWRDMASGQRFVCPESHTVEVKYEQCAACQKRTGFNPAFYHAASVSSQQEARNLEPHILYLAHFGPGVIKVGISHAKRGNSRLLEQGARSALVLDQLPSAHIARQYEARIATLSTAVETIQQRKKIELFKQPYDKKAAKNELHTMKQTIEAAVGSTFTGNDVVYLDTMYFPNNAPPLTDTYDMSDRHCISGEASGLLGSVLFCQQHDATLFLPLKKYIGYKVALTNDEITIDLPARQTSLF
ncbi:MAG TPA: DUF2797 domain-containing protein [Candidatus Saccharimonadales bacterium]|nr:DUF2797 domain-containing protein [Candidatus Saccharimonadales bacterium]